MNNTIQLETYVRDSVVFLAIISRICYFAFSEGVPGFAGSILKIAARLAHASHLSGESSVTL
jgi:hypothetical protein